MADLPLRVAVAALLATAACGPMSHAAIRPDLLDPATGRASPPLGAPPPERMRVAVYGDSQGNSAAHQAVVAAILAEKPDLVLFAGDAIDHLPAGHMPDWGGWQYVVPIWPQYVRGYAWVSLLTVIPFPAAIHETLLGAVAPPRKPPDLNVWLEDTAPLRKAGIPLLAAPGNHDEYHLVDQAQFASVFSPPGGPELPPDGFWYEVDRGGWRFLVLDTGTDMFGDRDPMPEGGPQLTWLEERLSDADRLGLRSIVLLHIPALLVGQGGAGGALGGAAGREGHPRSAPGGARALGPHPRLRAHRPPGLRGKAGELRGERRRRRDGSSGSPRSGWRARCSSWRRSGTSSCSSWARTASSGRALPVKVPGEEWRKPPSPLDRSRCGWLRQGTGLLAPDEVPATR